ncbi:hypothetical protein [Anaerosporobacter faecicola]|uniref:hypothetical protein n=1 Tax=Anaerosporobacter faecicola TaxID=2718714 RepID=UPI001439F0AB|nr:hypothetical protein [Anaerosporobacter faecicola]
MRINNTVSEYKQINTQREQGTNGTGQNTETLATSNANGITLNISNESRELLESQKRQAEEIQNRALLEMCEEQLEASKDAAKGVEDMGKMMEIARRIARGDKVPIKDEKKLMEYNSKLYQTAKAAAMLNMNKKHKKYKSMFDEENDEEQAKKIRDLDREDGADLSLDGVSETDSSTSAEESTSTEITE